MARKKVTFTFNWFWILILIGGYNMIFDDDKKTETQIVDQDQRPAVEDTESAEKIKTAVKEVVTTLTDEAKKAFDNAKQEIEEKKKEKEKEPDPPPKEIMTAEPEKGPDPRPLNTEPESTGGFKKL